MADSATTPWQHTVVGHILKSDSLWIPILATLKVVWCSYHNKWSLSWATCNPLRTAKGVVRHTSLWILNKYITRALFLLVAWHWRLLSVSGYKHKQWADNPNLCTECTDSHREGTLVSAVLWVRTDWCSFIPILHHHVIDETLNLLLFRPECRGDWDDYTTTKQEFWTVHVQGIAQPAAEGASEGEGHQYLIMKRAKQVLQYFCLFPHLNTCALGSVFIIHKLQTKTFKQSLVTKTL